MSKIIIHNESSHPDSRAINLVQSVVRGGFLSGENQYCWHTYFGAWRIGVTAMKTRGDTHTFKVRDEVIND